MTVAAPSEFRAVAKRRLPRFLFDYADGGANAEATMRANVADLASVALRQRVLRNVDSIDLTTSLFGRPQALPIMLGTIGIAGMYRRRGEVQAARAASRAGVLFTLSTVSLCSLGEVVQAASPIWFQLYVIRDRGFMREMPVRARAAALALFLFLAGAPISGAAALAWGWSTR